MFRNSFRHFFRKYLYIAGIRFPDSLSINTTISVAAIVQDTLLIVIPIIGIV